MSGKVTKVGVLIVGGGSAGITVAAHLLLRMGSVLKKQYPVAILEPSEVHYYQPMWTLVGGGIYPKEYSRRPESTLIPRDATWIKDAVASFCPEENYAMTQSGNRIDYDYLIVATGLKIDWNKIPGLAESVGKGGVCSNYSFETVDSTWENIRNFKGGTAIFTQPNPPIKCGGAPQKILYLAEDYFQKSGARDKSNVVFCSAAGSIFSVKKYADTLEQVLKRKRIETHFKHNLIALRPDTKDAVFQNLDTKEEVVMHYDMIHVTPPQSALDVVKQSSLANKDGWVDVDKDTLQHVRFPNAFSLGDASGLPTSKTGAAIRKQAPVAARNMISVMKRLPERARYNGYTSCPLVTGYKSLVMAEFDYDSKPAETFPIDQSKERYSMFLVKKYVLPRLYWHFMLKGWA
jgi:sulfide:quinone oxidoreductase